MNKNIILHCPHTEIPGARLVNCGWKILFGIYCGIASMGVGCLISCFTILSMNVGYRNTGLIIGINVGLSAICIIGLLPGRICCYS